ncbi:predicted protein [Nematostella vectensis]|uniref:SAM domain-containing protein n=1 Tax=Nematostella vectensis TaxID=45351 RepID=A7SXH5_NEMVE|nr:predicted protein [Nematostella vectensis]|eukprot:XP_001623689.1 predicted protein [Nematostella vectensis]
MSVNNVVFRQAITIINKELDKKVVLQTGKIEQRRHQLQPNNQNLDNSDVISPSVEERLRSLLSTPNPGGNPEDETEDELIIPPPRHRTETHNDEKFNVEERLRSLLDVAADDFSDDDDDDGDDFEPKREETFKQLDRIGYVPSHPSERMRNIEQNKGRNDSFTGGRRNRPGAKLPTPPALRRAQQMKNQRNGPESLNTGGSLDRSRKKPLPGQPRPASSAADLYSSKQQRLQPSYHRPTSFQANGQREDSPSKPRSPSHSEFLQQVANKLATEVDNRETTTTASSPSVSPPDTPMLPALSPSSSIATFMIGSSSNSSGISTPTKGFSSRLKGRSHSPRSISGGSTPRKGRRGRGQKGRNSDMENIRNQIQSLESMYSDVLCLLDTGTKDSGKKLKDQDMAVAAAALQKTEEMKAGINSFKKQRAKDIKAVNKRFTRLESHVVTLARSVAHLSSELRSQAAISEDLDEMRKELQQLRAWQEEEVHTRLGGVQQSLQYASNLKRVIKLRRFFGEEPPLLVMFLKKLGYERFAPNFAAEQIGVLELPYLSEERLQGLGIPLGPRLRIVEEATKMLT